MNLAAIVLAAGQGTRMRSGRAKVLHELGGEPMIARAVRTISSLGAAPVVVVVGHQAREVESALGARFGRDQLAFALQETQRGTGDAARVALAVIPANVTGDVLITYGDMPMVTAATLEKFRAAHHESGAKLSFISIKLADPKAYGRVVRDEKGGVARIVEHRDANESQRAINEINTGVYLVDIAFLRTALGELEPNNAQNEYYLTDLVAIARAHSFGVAAWTASDPAEFAGINSRMELAEMEATIRESTCRKRMEAGVTFIDPASAFIAEEAEIAPDCTIGPNVQILGHTKIASGVTIEGTAWLKNVTIGKGTLLKIGVRAEDAVIGDECEIGPFANLRAGTYLEGHNRIGNFVETKKARIGRGTKASHLTYLGDATIGRDTNVGCGVITVNYDGYEKHHTEIGDRCMVGCDTQLIAPVKVGSDVYVASGTTIMREVSDGALVMSHHPQRAKAGWMATWRKRHGDSPDGNGKRERE
jgi:bifunctional UDP-N-acetylglucosamine pyrophosphorylase / glucosamine-1-phosphate N-acetyltransferase